MAVKEHVAGPVGRPQCRQQIDQRQVQRRQRRAEPIVRAIHAHAIAGRLDHRPESLELLGIDLKPRGHQRNGDARARPGHAAGEARQRLARDVEAPAHVVDFRRRIRQQPAIRSRRAPAPESLLELTPPLAEDLQHDAGPDDPADVAHDLAPGAHDRQAARGQPERSVRGLDGVVGDEDHHHHQIGLQPRGHALVEQRVLDGPISLHARVDDPIVRRAAAPVQPPLELLAEGLLQRYLHGQHQRVAEHHNPALAWRLRANLVVADAGAVDRDVGRELRRRVADGRGRMEPVADDRVEREEVAERRVRLGASGDAQRSLEHPEPGEDDDGQQRQPAAGRRHRLSGSGDPSRPIGRPGARRTCGACGRSSISGSGTSAPRSG